LASGRREHLGSSGNAEATVAEQRATAVAGSDTRGAALAAAASTRLWLAVIVEATGQCLADDRATLVTTALLLLEQRCCRVRQVAAATSWLPGVATRTARVIPAVPLARTVRSRRRVGVVDRVMARRSNF
jgi:hypothetical protein